MAQPEKKSKIGACSAAVFANEVKTTNGTTVMKNVVLQRTYRDNNGDFQHTTSFRVNDIPKAVLALSKAYDYLTCEKPEQSMSNEKAE